MIAPTFTPPPVPSPGAVAWLVAAETTTTPDGDYTTTGTHRWDGYTAANLREHWGRRAKDARWTHEWDGDVLIVRSPSRGAFTVRTFHDSEPA